MKKIWARLGVNIILTDDEYEKLKSFVEDNDPYTEKYDRVNLNMAASLLQKKIRKGNFEIDGNSYCPAETLREEGISKRDDLDLD